MAEPIKVSLSKHARLDCLPLRHGKLFEEKKDTFTFFGEYDKKGTQNQKPIETHRGNEHFKGTLCHDKSGEEFEAVRVVLSKYKDNRGCRSVITVLPAETDGGTRGVSDLIKELRRSGDLSSKDIIEHLHPLYMDKRISNEADFFNELAKIYGEALVKKAQARVEELEAELARILEREKKSPKYKGEAIETAPPCTLKSVTEGMRTNRRGAEVRCVYLEFEEEHMPTRKMDQWADPSRFKKAKAESLVGRKVITTVWQPEIYSPLEWWRNIYEAD